MSLRRGSRTILIWLGLLFLGVAAATSQEAGEEDTLSWHSDYEEALAEARDTGKPIFLEFRCAPCINGRLFDAQVVYTPASSSRGKLLSQYVRARITTMTGVNIAHFDRDWHNSLYYFVINADEDIYLRYGGRDEVAATTYLDLESLELALEIGLREHRRFLETGERPGVDEPEPQPLKPADYRLLKENIIDSGRCTECHLIGDYSMQEKELAGLLDPIQDLYRSPDIKAIGLHLDIPKGLLLEKTTGATAEAGIQAGDLITSLNGHRVLTFGDLQYRYDQVPRRTAKAIVLGVEREGEAHEFTVDLPFEWWKSGLEFRHWTVEPRLFFAAEPLTDEEKVERNLPSDGFASRVTEVEIEAVISDYHSLEVGDIVTAVNDRKQDALTGDLEAHIKIRFPPESELKLTVLRGEASVEVLLKTQRLNFRKLPTERENTDLSILWSEPDFVRNGDDIVLRYRAAIADGHLLIEARHEPGWHSYAMDNPERAIEKLGKKTENQDLPTVINLPEGLHTAGAWKQSVPIDYSKPEIRWHTWGFEGTSWFAIELEQIPEEPFSISVTSQVCDADSCAGTFDLKLTVPSDGAAPRNLFTERILQQLEPVRSGGDDPSE